MVLVILIWSISVHNPEAKFVYRVSSLFEILLKNYAMSSLFNSSCFVSSLFNSSTHIMQGGGNIDDGLTGILNWA